MDNYRNWLGLDGAQGHTLSSSARTVTRGPPTRPFSASTSSADPKCWAPRRATQRAQPTQNFGTRDQLSQPGHREGPCHLGGRPAFPPSPGLPWFPDCSPQPPGRGPLASSLSLPHTVKLSAGRQWPSLAGLRNIPGGPSGPTHWTTRLHPHSHGLVGPAWSARGHVRGRTLCLELSQRMFLPTKRRRQACASNLSHS